MLACLHYVVKLNLGILAAAVEGPHYFDEQQAHLHQLLLLVLWIWANRLYRASCKSICTQRWPQEDCLIDYNRNACVQRCQALLF
uniref:Uncharacterized protein n=1 Tax=Rhipicephalus zambeziensis TaxID=60191 RepID=A0A224YGP1_9ACAR